MTEPTSPSSSLPNPEDLIEGLSPLNQIDRKYHTQLKKHIRLMPIEEGNWIIRKSRDPKLNHYLISGEAELRHSFEDRQLLSTEAQHYPEPLEKSLRERSSIKALQPCIVLVVNNVLCLVKISHRIGRLQQIVVVLVQVGHGWKSLRGGRRRARAICIVAWPRATHGLLHLVRIRSVRRRAQRSVAAYAGRFVCGAERRPFVRRLASD